MKETTKRKFIWPVIAVSCLPIALLASAPKQLTPSGIALYISALAGYVGVIFLLWMYILGAKSAMGVIFKDLASVISIHKKLGKWGSIAFLLHPIFVSYSYYDLSAKSLVYIVWPEISTQFDRWVTLGRVAFFLLLMVWLTSKLYRKKLGFRVWKYLHYFAYIALPFVLLHIPGIGSQYLAHPLVRVYYILIVGVFLLFSLFRISAWLNLDRTKYIITSSRQITPEDFVMTLQPADKPLKIKIGQYVYVKVGMISEDHPFSVTHRDIKTDVLTVTYRVYGSFTKYLTTLRPHRSCHWPARLVNLPAISLNIIRVRPYILLAA